MDSGNTPNTDKIVFGNATVHFILNNYQSLAKMPIDKTYKKVLN